jgi:Zn-dependent protease
MERLKFHIHFSFYLVLGLAFLTRQVELLAAYIVALVLHELAHYFVAKKLFFQCTKMQLSAFGAVLYGEFDDARGKNQFLIAIAGPLCNLILALLCAAVWWIEPETYVFTLTFAEANIGMAAVNMIPAYPLDGGKVLLGLLEAKYSPTKAMAIVKAVCVVLSLILFAIFVVGLFFGEMFFSLGMFAIFLFSGYMVKNSGNNYRRISFFTNFNRRINVGVEKKTLIFSKNTTFDKVICRMVGGSLYCLEIVDDDFKVVQCIGVGQLNYLLTACPPSTKLTDIGEYLDGPTTPRRPLPR